MVTEQLPSEKPMHRISLKKNFAWTWFGNVVYLGTQWAMLVVLTKIGSLETVGQFFLGLAITTPVIIFSQMQLRETLVTDATGEFHLMDYFLSRIILTIGALAGISIWLFLMKYQDDLVNIALLIALSKSFESISDIAYGKFQKDGRMDYIAISMIIKGILTLTVFSWFLFQTKNLNYAIASMAAINLAMLLFFDGFNFFAFSKQEIRGYVWKFSSFSSLCRTAFPLSIVSGLTSFSGNVPRYFLQYFSGKEAVGMFSVASVPLNFVTSIQMAVGQTIMAKAAEHYQSGNEEGFNRLSWKMTLICLSTGVFFSFIFFLWGREMMCLLFSPAYIPAVTPLVIMAWGSIFAGLQVHGNLVFLSGRMFNIKLLFMVMTVVFQGVFGYFLIAKWSVLGAAWLDFSRQIVQLLFSWRVGKLKNRFENSRINCPQET